MEPWELTDEEILDLRDGLDSILHPRSMRVLLNNRVIKPYQEWLASQPYKCSICGKEGESAGCFSCAEQEWTTRIMYRLAKQCRPSPCTVERCGWLEWAKGRDWDNCGRATNCLELSAYDGQQQGYALGIQERGK